MCEEKDIYLETLLFVFTGTFIEPSKNRTARLGGKDQDKQVSVGKRGSVTRMLSLKSLTTGLLWKKLVELAWQWASARTERTNVRLPALQVYSRPLLFIPKLVFLVPHLPFK